MTDDDPVPDIFAPENLRQQIDAAFATIPEGHHSAMVAWWTTDGRWKFTVVHRIVDHWSMGATFGQDEARGKIVGGVTVQGSW